jgi:outer membrane lipoprotein-sorting protein
MIAAAALLFAALQDADAAARDALQALAAGLKEAKTMRARVVQSRRTELLDEPIRSSGTLAYRREPGQLSFRLSEPRRTEILIDRTSYQVHRPEEKRMERFDFAEGSPAARLLDVFDPKPDDLGKAFAVKGGALKAGEVEVVLEPRDDKAKAYLKRLRLAVGMPGGLLKRVEHEDAEGDRVTFELEGLELNPKLDEDLFRLVPAEGTRILRHAVRLTK